MNDSILNTDNWLNRKGPEDHIAISSRARYARNLPMLPFPLRARPEELRQVVETVGPAIRQVPAFQNNLIFNLAEVPSAHRHFLKENHLISSEMEKGGAHRVILLTGEADLAAMVNEEDHLRLFALEPGLQLPTVLNNVMEFESHLEQSLEFAFSPNYGFLTACPTNTGTGLRASVLLHLPALAATRSLTELARRLRENGLTIRGPYGENSEEFGELFQVSNEVTLGRNEEEIVTLLAQVVDSIIHDEESARRQMYERAPARTDDVIWRAWGLLTNARVLTAEEAVHSLSRLRIGVDRQYFKNLTHAALNRLLVDVQPGHVRVRLGDAASQYERDEARATYVRERLLHPPATTAE